jgi:hypothetical protein
VSRITFSFFMQDQLNGPGENNVRVMRFDRSVEVASFMHSLFSLYALIMVLIFPVGVPVLYFLLYYRYQPPFELRALPQQRDVPLLTPPPACESRLPGICQAAP